MTLIIAYALAGGFEPRSHGYPQAAARCQLKNIGTALETYRTEVSAVDRYPAADGEPYWYTWFLLEELERHGLFDPSDEMVADHPAFDDRQVLVDPWGTPLKYRPWRGSRAIPSSTHNRNSYDLWSAGPDRLFGPGDENEDGVDDAEDNICNWSVELERMGRE